MILLGGTLVVTPRVEGWARQARIIAADGGIAHARALDVTPELWIGDFDSASMEDQALFRAVPRAEFPADKAKTDGELAIEAAMDRGARRIVLAGAFGGARFDQVFSHVALALAHASDGLDLLLTSGAEEAVPLVNGAVHRPGWPSGTRFSVLAFNDLSGLTVAGADWPLDAVDVPFGSTWTLSNRVDGDVSIRLSAGHAVAVASLMEEKP